MTLLPRTLDILADLVAFPTVSSASNRAITAYMADLLTPAGWRVEILPDPTGEKANLFATLGPDAPGGLVLSGHSDVVPVADQAWNSDPFALTPDGDRLFGRGTCDMKGFLACALALAETLDAAALLRPLHLCVTHDEEVGCLGARAAIPQLAARGHAPAMAIVGEPTGMALVDGHKGCFEYTTRFFGLEGHGSDPDAGVNAVMAAVEFASRLMSHAGTLRSRARPDSGFDPPWTTINIGRLSGGAAHNIIPGRAELAWEMRPIRPADAAFVRQAMDAFVTAELLPAMQAVHPSARIETEIVGEVAGLTPTPENAALALLASLTGRNAAARVPFGTEAGLFQEWGLSVVVCGPGDIAQAHKPDEFITRDQLSRCLALLARVAASLSQPARSAASDS